MSSSSTAPTAARLDGVGVEFIQKALEAVARDADQLRAAFCCATRMCTLARTAIGQDICKVVGEQDRAVHARAWLSWTRFDDRRARLSPRGASVRSPVLSGYGWPIRGFASSRSPHARRAAEVHVLVAMLACPSASRTT